MSQENQNPKNTVATVGMWFSIIGLIALISIVLMRLGLPLLFIGFIFGIVGFFYKPRGKARVAVCIPLVVFLIIASLICYIWSSVKTPAKEWYNWTQTTLEQLNDEGFDNDRFNGIFQEELNKMSSSLSELEVESTVEASTGSNIIEKGAYFGFGLLQQAFENAIERYYANEEPEIDDEDIIEIDTKENEDTDNEDIQPEETSSETVNNTFTASERNDIEQILNILE